VGVADPAFAAELIGELGKSEEAPGMADMTLEEIFGGLRIEIETQTIGESS
jgi:hypothetical protein